MQNEKQVTSHRSTYKVAGIRQVQVTTRAYVLCRCSTQFRERLEPAFRRFACIASAVNVFRTSFVLLCINMKFKS